MTDQSAFIGHEACEECGSRDNKAIYASGRTYCFGCEHSTFPENYEHSGPAEGRRRTVSTYDLIPGEIRGLTKEIGLSEDTCKKLGIRIIRYAPMWAGERLAPKSCIAFDYHKPEGGLHGQKVRYANPDPETDKTFAFPNGGGKAPLWLQHLWTPGGDTRAIVIFEGEKDAASYFQVTGGKYPVVSVPTGAKGAVGALRDHYEWLDRFDKIVLVFDGDATGREWATQAAQVLPGGKVHIGEVQGFKDANEALKSGAAGEIQRAFHNATLFKPDGIVTSAEALHGLRQRRLAQDVATITYPWPKLQELTRGMKEGSLITWTAGSGIGKSTIVRHVMHHVHKVHGERVGMLMLEEDKDETIDGFIGIELGKNLLLDPKLCTDEEHAEAAKALGLDDPEKGIVLYDHFGSTDVDNICARVRFMAKALGCKVIGLDHISIMVSGTDTGDERKLIDMAMTKLRTLVQECKIILHAVVHLRRPQGDKGHEDGAAVSLGQLRGSHSIAQLSDTCIAGRKDPENPHSNFIDLDVLKNRRAGRKGPADRLSYSHDSGCLGAVDRDGGSGFQDHTSGPSDGGLDL